MFCGVEAIIFDCDGTLVDSAPIYAAAWGAGLASSGMAIQEDWYRERNGLSEDVLMDAFEAMAGVVLDRAAIVEKVRATFLANISGLEEVTRVATAARMARGQMPIAVASGGPAAVVRPSLQQTGLLDLFGAVVTFDDVGVPKPAPDLFVEAAKRLAVEAKHCLVVEDSPAGMQAAEAAGMQVVNVHDAEAVAALTEWLGRRSHAGRSTAER